MGATIAKLSTEDLPKTHNGIGVESPEIKYCYEQQLEEEYGFSTAIV